MANQDPILMDFVKSKEFQAAEPGLRKVLLTTYQTATPEQRKQFVYGDDSMQGLTLSQEPNENFTPEGRRRRPANLDTDIQKALEPTTFDYQHVAPVVIDTVGQAGGALVGGALGGPVGAAGIGAAGAVAANQAKKYLGLQPGKAGSLDMSDIVAGGLPLAVGAGQGIWSKYLTRPAQQAIRTADAETAANKVAHQQKIDAADVGRAEDMLAADKAAESTNAANRAAFNKETAERATYNTEEAARVQQANAKAQSQYDTKVAEAQRTGDEAVSRAKDRADAKTAANLKAWEDEGKTITLGFQRDMQDIARRTDLSNQQKTQLYQERALAHRQRIEQHNASRGTYERTIEGVTIDDPKPAYKASAEAAGRAKPVDVSSLNKTAEGGAEFLEGPVDPQNPVSRIARALKSWGAGKPATEATSPVLDASGQPVRSTVAATPSEVTVDELIDVHQDLGRAIGKASGKQLKVLTSLYKQADSILSQHAQTDPATAKAYAKHVEGQALFKRQQSFKEVEEAINSGVTNPAPGQWHANTPAIRKKLLDLQQNGFGGITDGEWKKIWAEVDKLPTQPIGKAPTAPKTKQPDFTEAELERDRRLADRGPAPEPVEPGGPDVQSPYPGPRPPLERPRYKTPPVQPEEVKPDYSNVRSPYTEPEPAPVQPDVAKTPWGRLIMARALGGDAVAQVMGQAGNNFVAGMAILIGVGAPVWVSNTLLKSATGQQIVRNVMKSKGSDATKLAALTTAARSLGGRPEDEAK